MLAQAITNCKSSINPVQRINDESSVAKINNYYCILPTISAEIILHNVVTNLFQYYSHISNNILAMYSLTVQINCVAHLYPLHFFLQPSHISKSISKDRERFP